MDWIVLLWAGLFGLIVGSFLNVVLFRMHTGRSLAGRSGCLSCRHQLAAKDLVPVLSFLWLGGRCRYCGSRISWQYPLVEFAVAAAFVLAVWRFGITWEALFAGVVLVSSIAISVYDWRHKIIPDELNVALFIGVLGFVISSGAVSIPAALLSGFFLALPFAALWGISQGRWMGLGDAKLAISIGVLLGLARALAAVSFAAVVGAVYGLVLMALARLCKTRFSFCPKQVTMKTEVPFGPFLLLGMLLVWLLQIDVWYFQLLLGI